MVTYTALATRLRANAAAVATAAASGTTAAEITGLAELLDILAAQKGLGLSPLLKSSSAKAQLNPQ